MIHLTRDFLASATQVIPASTSSSGEIEIHLSKSVNPAEGSHMGYLLVAPGGSHQESIFFHRSAAGGTVVYCYDFNRTWHGSHPIGVQVVLSNSIDYMNYLLNQARSHGFLYQKDAYDFVVKGGLWYMDAQNIEIADLDTSENIENKTLTNNCRNYVYVVPYDYRITTEPLELEAFLLYEVDVDAGWVITKITPANTQVVGNKGEAGEQGIQGAKGDKGDTGPQGPAGITPSFAVGTVVGVDPIDSETFGPASVTISGPANAKTFAFQIPRGLPGKNGTNGTIATAPPGEPQTVDDNVVPPPGSTVTTDNATYVRVTLSDGAKVEYDLTGIRTYDSGGELVSETLKTGTWITSGIQYSDSTVDKVTGIVNFTGNPAYKNGDNVFTESNVFEWDVVFRKRVSFPFHNMGSQGGAINFNGTNGTNQKVTLTGTSTHVLNPSYLTQGVYILFVAQTSTGGIQFANPTNSWDVIGVAIMNASFVNDWSVANAPGTHIFTILVAETKIHVTYNWTSV